MGETDKELAGDAGSQRLPFPDAVLVKRAQAGDRASFDELARRYETRIRKITRRILGSNEDADEALRETFSRAYGFLPKFEFRSSFYTWLYRIATNVSLTKLRKRRAHLADKSRVPLNDGGTPTSMKADETSAATPESGRNDLLEAMRRVIDDLPADYRIVTALRELDGLSNQEIGEKLNLSVAAVKSRLHRGRILLRQGLARASGSGTGEGHFPYPGPMHTA